MAEYRIPNVNSIIISGRATSDSTLSYTESGKAYLRFRIASNRNYRDKNSGEWKEDTTFVSATIWGSYAERLSEQIKKGTPVLIEGRLTSYTREVDGLRRTEVSIAAFKTQVLEKGKTPYKAPDTTAEGEEDTEAMEPPGDEEELPF